MGKAAKHDRSRHDLDLPPLAAWSLGRTGADITVTIGCLSFHPVSGGSSIEADKALPHPQSPRSNTLQYFYLQCSKMRCIVKENNIFKSKNISWFRNFEF